MTFEYVGNNLSITAYVNDDEYGGGDDLYIVLDKNRNGKIDLGMSDEPFRFSSNNYTGWTVGLLEDGSFIIASGGPYLSQYHSALFKPETGYIWRISLPLEREDLGCEIVHVVYEDSGPFWQLQPGDWDPSKIDWTKYSVCIRFNFGV